MSKPIAEISTAALAYLGDSVIELCVREMLVECGISSAKNLNAASLDFVKADSQAEAMAKIIPHLTEEENMAFRRGKNVSHANVPKSATPEQYRIASGMETLFGHLHLAGRTERIKELFALAYEEKIKNLQEKMI